jgi:predicted nucleotidyltransferase
LAAPFAPETRQTQHTRALRLVQPFNGEASCLPTQILLWVAGMMETGDIISELRAALPGLREQWPIRSLALFGSRMRDDATPDSDLDVLVEFARPVALSSFLALEERLATITGLRIDLVSVAALKPYIGERVRAEAVTL